MPYTLDSFANGDTAYVGKLNYNFTTVEQALNAFEAAFTSQAQTLNIGRAFEALFGTSPAVIGSGSYVCTINGSNAQRVDIAPGFAWLNTLGAVVRLQNAAQLDFTALANGTYYVSATATGQPLITSVTTDALYKVVKANGDLEAPIRIAAIAWGEEDWIAVQNPGTGFFPSLAQRLAAIEAGTGQPYDVLSFVPGKPTPDAAIVRLVMVRNVTFAAGLTGSRAYAGTAPTTDATITIYRGLTAIGSLTFAAGAQSASFTFNNPVTFTAGEQLVLKTSAIADATLSDLSISLTGKR